MFRKSYWKKRFAPVLAGALVISSLLVPPGHAFAADPVTSEEQTVSPETPEVKDVTDSTDAATTDANLTTPDSVSDSVSDSVAGTSATDASSGKEAAKQDVKETKEVKAADDAVTDPIPDKTPHLVYGDKSLADEDAFVQSVIFCGQFIHAILFCSLLLRLLSFDFSLRIFLAQAGQYLDAPEPGTYSTPHTVQFLAGIAAHRFVGMICNSSTKPMNL